MKNLVPYIFIGLLAGTASAQAACYVDYKAKQDNPLKLHYGIIKLSDDDCGGIDAKQAVSDRISRDGWTLLNILGTFGDDGLERRRGNAGQFFLRY